MTPEHNNVPTLQVSKFPVSMFAKCNWWKVEAAEGQTSSS